MSYTRLFAYSIVPCLLITAAVTGAAGELSWPFAIVGLIAEGFIIARFFDKRREDKE